MRIALLGSKRGEIFFEAEKDHAEQMDRILRALQKHAEGYTEVSLCLDDEAPRSFCSKAPFGDPVKVFGTSAYEKNEEPPYEIDERIFRQFVGGIKRGDFSKCDSAILAECAHVFILPFRMLTLDLLRMVTVALGLEHIQQVTLLVPSNHPQIMQSGVHELSDLMSNLEHPKCFVAFC